MSEGRVLVTGASRGIGRLIATRLAEGGRPVTACARQPAALDDVVHALPGAGHRALALDVADATAWNDARSELRDVTGIVCAAGIIGPIGDLEDVSADAFTETLRTNVAGAFLAVQAVASQLRATGGSAVVLSGGGATGPFPRFDAYAASKAAVVRLVENLASGGLRINAIAPGFIVTSMQDEVLAASPEAVGHAYYERVHSAVEGNGGDDPGRAAELASFLLSDDAHGISGKLLSAVWDPWEDERFRLRLRHEKDLATLRRIDDHFFACKS